MDDVFRLHLNDKQKTTKVKAILQDLILTESALKQIKDVFEKEMELALNMQPSSLQMENTYIPELPDGSENGIFLAMDLGGTNLRVLLLHLHNGKVINETVEYFDIPDSLRVGCGNKLFEYLANCVDEFALSKKLLDNIIYPLGFTFSFPMRQNGLDSGVLVTWTKSFNCPSLVGQDAVEKLRECLVKKNRTNIEVVAILNDTTGTLVHGALEDPRTRIGIVLGTGSNACYMERADRVKHWYQRHDERHVIIDIEWGAFGDNGVLDFIRTEFDRALDESSLLRNSFTFEKYIGGKYLGELCRFILQKLHKEALFLPHLPMEAFPKPWSFGTDNVSAIEQSSLDSSCNNAEQVLMNHFNCVENNFTSDDIRILRYVCSLISFRAAQLVAVNTSVLLNRMDYEYEGLDAVTVAIDGSVYKHHPRMKDWITELTKMWAPKKACTYILAEDGSGKGAALVAAIANKIKNRNFV